MPASLVHSADRRFRHPVTTNFIRVIPLDSVDLELWTGDDSGLNGTLVRVFRHQKGATVLE